MMSEDHLRARSCGLEVAWRLHQTSVFIPLTIDCNSLYVSFLLIALQSLLYDPDVPETLS